MRVYVAGKWEEREAVKKLQQALIKMGHTITVDWTGHEIDDEGYPLTYAQDDVRGVQEADAYVGRFLKENNYKGALVELGVALGLNKQVYIIGHAIDSCLFVHHFLVRIFDTEPEFLAYMELLSYYE